MAFRFRILGQATRAPLGRGIRAPISVRGFAATTRTANTAKWMFAGVTVVGAGAFLSVEAAPKVDFVELRKDLAKVIHEGGKYDDGSYGPVLVRLAWHASGTYSVFSNDGGSDGATMRFAPECKFGANAGLDVARNILEPIKKKYKDITYADLWTLAGCVAIEEMGGPHINWRPGRIDKAGTKDCPPDGRLPDAARGADHIRAIFYRMGFSDQEIVALIGAHALGRCHTTRSGFDGPWTFAPTVFSNDFFTLLLNEKWTVKDWKGPKQFENGAKNLMMLPADLALVEDADFKKWVVLYAANNTKFFADFSAAFGKLMDLGVPFSTRT